MTEKVEWRRPTSRTLSSSQGWWRRKAAWNSRIYALHEPARFFLSGFGQARAFGTANQPQRQATKQHLYLVLDDQEDAYSIYKLDIDNDPEVGCISTVTPLLLPEPPLDVDSISEETPMRLPEQPLPKPRIRSIDYNTVSKGAKFAAIGSHIIAISPYTKGKRVTLTFNTKTAKLIVSHVLPEGLICGYDTAIAVRNRLYVFESFTDLSDGLDGSYFRGGLHCLSEGACVDDESHWGWQPISNFSPFVWSWSLSRGTPKLPFDPKTITGHAVHPKTGTIFVSVGGHVSFGTFSYVFRGCSQWKCLGDWLLPFKGPAHYDEALEAWVGLHLSVDTGDADGYLCASSVMSDSQQPNLKVGRDMLFLKDPYWNHVDAKLVHMGEHNSKYCLVERLQPKGADKMKYVLRLTTFIVKYDKDGDLKIMAPQPARLYKAPSYCCCFDIHAFWM